MTDDNNKKTEQDIDTNIDLEKEIASLDDFLNAQDDDEFAFDDDVVAKEINDNQSNKSGSASKYISYALLIAAIGGMGYAGIKYAPQLMGTSALNELQANIVERDTNDFIGFDSAADSAPTQISPEISNPITTEAADTITPEVADLSMTNDVVIESPVVNEETQNIPEFEMAFENDMALEPEMMAEPQQAFEILPEQPIEETPAVAQTISEALDIAQNADSIDNNEAETELNVEMSPVEPDLRVNMERIPAAPLNNSDDLPPLDEQTVETANQVMQMDEAEIIETVEATENVATQVNEIVENSSLSEPVQDVIVEEAVDNVAEQAVEIVTEAENNNNAPTAPVEIEAAVEDTVSKATEVVAELEVIEVETQKAEPVKVSEPKKAVVNNKPVIQADPRLKTARAAFDKGDYTTALDIYNQILKSNSADTSALTGKQLATAKLRMQNTATPNSVPSVPQTSVEMPKDAVSTSSTSIQTLMSQMNADPRDAITALKLGDAYRDAGNKSAASEWYRKALQLDVIYPAGLDRMSVYDRIADVQ